MYKIAVLMSTYNGEKYLREQIDSIINQTDVDVSILIRDDGSSDNTVNIIKEYAEKVSFVTGVNLGYANSFLTLLKFAMDADYYAFADQDDVWEPDKLSSAVRRISKNKKTIYASSLKVVDENLGYLSKKTYDRYIGTVGSTLTRNSLAGCTMVFSRDVRQIILRDIDKIISENEKLKYGHDGWVLLVSLLHGCDIVVDENSYINYRRHSSTITNVSGGLRKRIKNEWTFFWNKEGRKVAIAKFLVENALEDADEDALSTLRLVAGYKESVKKRIRLLSSNRLRTNIPIVDVINKIAVLLGRY